MQAVREYLLQVTAAAVVCGIVTSLIGKNNTLGKVIQMLAGFFMALAVVGPWVNLRLDNIKDITSGFSDSADAFAEAGEASAKEAMAKIIKEKTEAYILDKAKKLGAELTVAVTLDEQDHCAPCAVTISGSVSPYARQVLSDLLEEDLGISTEDQKWTG